MKANEIHCLYLNRQTQGVQCPKPAIRLNDDVYSQKNKGTAVEWRGELGRRREVIKCELMTRMVEGMVTGVCQHNRIVIITWNRLPSGTFYHYLVFAVLRVGQDAHY